MSVKLVHDTDYIIHIFNHLSRQKTIPVCLKSEGCIEFESIMSVMLKKNNYIEIEIQSPEYDLSKLKFKCYTLFHQTFEGLFSFDIKAIGQTGNSYKISTPECISIYLRRRFSRYDLNKNNQTAYIYVPSIEKIFNIIDISLAGLSFECNQIILRELETISNIKINVSKKLELTCDAQVRHIRQLSFNRYIYGIQLLNIDDENINKLYLYIFKNCYSQLEFINDFTNTQNNRIKTLYLRKLKQLALNPRIKKSAQSLLSVLQLKDNVIVNSWTAFKVFPYTFMCPLEFQLLDVSTAPADKISILAGAADALINNPQFQYYILYTHLNSEYAHAILSAHKLIETSDQFLIDKMCIFECNVEKIIAYNYDHSHICRDIANVEKFTDYCSNKLPTLEVKSYGYSLKQLIISNPFRSCAIISCNYWEISNSKGQIVAYVVGYVGNNKALDMCTIYINSKYADIVQVIKSLVPVAAQYYSKYSKKHFHIHINHSSFNNVSVEEIQMTEVWGVKFKYTVLRAILSYTGMLEFKSIIAATPLYVLKYFPLTYSQKLIWNVEKTYSNTSIGNVAGTVRIMEQVDFDILERAINLVIKNNDSIRLRLLECDSQPIQYISSYEYKSIETINFNNDVNRLYKWDKQQTLSNFRLIESDLFYVAMFKINEFENGFYLKLHHIVSDGWSIVSILGNEVIKLYYDMKNKKLIDTNPSPSYINYILSEIEYMASKKFKESEFFWDNIFKTMPEVTELKPDIVSNVSSTVAARKTFLTPEPLCSKTHKFCNDNRYSPFVLFLTTIYIYVSKTTTNHDIVIGAPTFNRTTLKDKLTCGMFANTLPIRLSIDNNVNFKDCISIVSKQLISYLKHQRYPYELIQKRFREKHKVFHNLFDTVVSYQNASVETLKYPSQVKHRWHFNHNQTESLAIHISDRDKQGVYLINLDYLVNKFSEDEIVRMSEHLLILLENLIQNPLKEIRSIEFISDVEKNTLLNMFNNTYMEYPRNRTINDLIEEQARNIPDNIAIICDDKSLTYSELNCRANQLARTLQHIGAKPDSIVGIIINRSVDMIVAILGVLKAGAAYMPMDPDYPKDRIEFMINDSNASIIITQTHILDNFKLDKTIINLDDNNVYNEDNSNLEIINTSANLAYVIYTSGSTGCPKGVMIEHGSVINLIWGALDIIGNLESETILSATTMSFDIFIFEALLPLVRGLKIVIANQLQQNNPSEITKLICSSHITLLQLTPSRAELLLKDDNGYNALRTIKKIMLTGEALSVELYTKLKSICNAEIFNGYGPTETTVWSTIKKLIESGPITIGTPIANTHIYILDNSLNMMPIGVVGELCIAGDGLARGYLNREDLTSEKFVYLHHITNERIYKTGDLAKWLPSGEIEILGRIDNQVKLRGFRIELEEVENLLQKHPYIDHATVVLSEGLDGNKYLNAYIVSQINVNYNELKKYLSNMLPYYMIPSRFTKIDKLPLTPNGKVDRKALIGMYQQKHDSLENIKPLNDTEQVISDIWKEELQLNNIGVTDDYFAMGGDSIKAINLIYKIYKKMNIEITFRDIIKHTTIRQLAYHISNINPIYTLHISPSIIKSYYTVSASQKRVFLLSQIEGSSSINYNMPILFSIRGHIDIKQLEHAFKKIIQRHEILRTSFQIIDNDIVQKIVDDVEFYVNYVEDISADNIEKLITPFSLVAPPLIKVILGRLSKDEFFLLIDIHHIISDGTSINILLREVKNIYEGLVLPDLITQYKDFSEWHNQLISTGKLNVQRQFWLNIFRDTSHALNMPIDYTRPTFQSFSGDRIFFELDLDITQKLENICLNSKSTLFMILFAAYNSLLYRYTGQNDIVVGTAVSGRQNVGLENLIGMFVNTLPIRSYPSSKKTFREFWEEVMTSCFNAFENQDYPFDLLVEELKIKRDLMRNPLFDTMFILHNTNIEDISINGVQLIRQQMAYKISKLDITLNAFKRGGKGILFELEYCTKLFKKTTMKRFIGHFLKILDTILQNPDTLLSEFDILTECEKDQILNRFNNTHSEYRKDSTLHQLFEEQVSKHPNKVAIVCENQSITYIELHKSSNKLAYILRQKGVSQNNPVVIMVERSIELLICILGVLKSGGAYVPIDPEYPKERVKFILEDSKADIILTRHHLETSLQNICESSKIITLEEVFLDSSENFNVENINHALDLAYIIYTSGSTGKPKGVMINHRSVINLIHGMSQKINIHEDSSMLALASASFDMCIPEIILPLVKGIKMVLATSHQQIDIRELCKLVYDKNVSMMQITPSRMQLILEDDICRNLLHKVKDIMVGAEAVSASLIKNLKRTYSARLYNMYGPTETTVWSTIAQLSSENKRSSTIGKPISNTKIFILDNNYKMQPIGLIGELYISGDGLCKGYLNDEELNKNKFIRNLFGQGRLYKTGDLARWLPDGNIEFIGREDDQVKIRGYRVELEEIESYLQSYPHIKQVAVIMKKESDLGANVLYAYYTCANNVLPSDLRNYLREKIPIYMIPSLLIKINEMPLTTNNKVNKTMLRNMDTPTLKSDSATYVKPIGKIEIKLAEAWGKALGIKNVSAEDNFFDIGGDSLGIIRMISFLKKYHLELDTKKIYKYPTIRKLSKFIKTTANQSQTKSIINKPKYAFESNQHSLISIEETCLYKLIQDGTIPNVDAAALSYIPDDFLILSGQTKKEIIENVFNNKPNLYSIFYTEFGSIALVMMPIFFSDIYSDESRLLSLSMDSLKLSQEVGAKVISLTGLIPSATDYGYNILEKANNENVSIQITTGHTTTCAAIALSLERLLKESNRNLCDEKVCVLGLGRIGKAIIELIIEALPNPKSLVLCDIYEKKEDVESIGQHIKQKTGFKGDISFAYALNGEIPKQVYESTLIIGATNVPEVIDVKKLNPGTLIIDDSSPHCFSISEAIDRIARHKDILLTEGGVLQTHIPVRKILGLRHLHPNILAKYDTLLSYSNKITGCILSGLLSSKFKQLKPVVGQTLVSDSYAHFWQLKNINFSGAAPHCEDFVIPQKYIKTFRRNFGKKE